MPLSCDTKSSTRFRETKEILRQMTNDGKAHWTYTTEEKGSHSAKGPVSRILALPRHIEMLWHSVPFLKNRLRQKTLFRGLEYEIYQRDNHDYHKNAQYRIENRIVLLVRTQRIARLDGIAAHIQRT